MLPWQLHFAVAHKFAKPGSRISTGSPGTESAGVGGAKHLSGALTCMALTASFGLMKCRPD